MFKIFGKYAEEKKGVHRGYEPRVARRQLEQQDRELPRGLPQQQQPRQSQQQRGVSCDLRPVAHKQSRMAADEQMNDPAPDFFSGQIRRMEARYW